MKALLEQPFYLETIDRFIIIIYLFIIIIFFFFFSFVL